MRTVGVTGGIGSGKSLVCRIFAGMGVSVYDSDQRARYITEHDPDIRREIASAFPDALDRNGEPDRKRLAGIVFRDKNALERLNAIVHPAVGRDFSAWLGEHPGAPYIIREAAILFESGAYRRMDAVISVSAPAETRIARVMERDGVGREAVLERMANQLDQEAIDTRADVVIVNDGRRMLIPQIVEIHGKILRKELFL